VSDIDWKQKCSKVADWLGEIVSAGTLPYLQDGSAAHGLHRKLVDEGAYVRRAFDGYVAESPGGRTRMYDTIEKAMVEAAVIMYDMEVDREEA